MVVQWKEIEFNKVPRMIRESDIYATEDWEITAIHKGRGRLVKLRFFGGTEHVWKRLEAKGAWKLIKVWRRPKAEAASPVDDLQPGLEALRLLTRGLTPEEAGEANRLWSRWIMNANAATGVDGVWASWQAYQSSMNAGQIVMTNSGYRKLIKPAPLPEQAENRQ